MMRLPVRSVDDPKAASSFVAAARSRWTRAPALVFQFHFFSLGGGGKGGGGDDMISFSKLLSTIDGFQEKR